MTNSEEEAEALARHGDAVRRNQVVLGGRRAGKTERLRKWQEEHNEVLGVLTGQVPVKSMPVAGVGHTCHVATRCRLCEEDRGSE